MLKGSYLISLLVCIYTAAATENGIFQGPFYSMTITDAYHMQAGDIDQDGRADLVFCCGDYSQGHYYRIYHGSNNGVFTLVSQAPFYRNFDYLAYSFPDVTGDGLPDVIFSVESLYMLYSGDGSGWFSYLSSPNPGVGGHYMHDTEDCNNDSLSDFLFSSKKPGQSLCLGLNDGTGMAEVSWSDFNYYHETDIATLCDVNQDGIADIVAAFTRVDSMAVYLGNGDGTFMTPLRTASPPFGNSDEGIICDTDLNADGYPDVVVVAEGYGSGQMLTYSGSPLGNMELMDEYLQEVSVDLDVETMPIAADFNMDGHTDIVIQGSMGWVLPGLEGGCFDDLTTQALFYIEDGVTEMDTSDVDLDGDIDLLILTDDSLMIWLNQTLSTGIYQNGTEEIDFSAFPNPASNSVFVNIDSPHSASQLDLYDLSGRMIRSIDASCESNLQIDLSNLSSGIYLFRLSSGDQQQSLKLVLTRN